MEKIKDRPFEEIKERMFKIGTVNLNIGFIAPGCGNHFLSTGSLLHIGNKIAIVQLYLHNDKKTLIAVGMGTYALV